ncbi:uncharacterized protein EI90DRAFT_3019771 [Cantharellus anzutake]|uniref:uncharacterized protein n=1 Tax=Cantharellus anzutake TaxID=1750568 RepID=UPI001907A540|nr:uncharacterized protein EI90DRAFT_3019771 [Cantharellus anzutake]KAF8323581.1 hypothetical protein EI90DRAFT_3019771 [Cantharellus anzutake]
MKGHFVRQDRIGFSSILQSRMSNTWGFLPNEFLHPQYLWAKNSKITLAMSKIWGLLPWLSTSSWGGETRKHDPLLAVELGTEVEHWKIEWDHVDSSPSPHAPILLHHYLTKACICEAKEKVPDDDPSLDPPEPGNHNGFLGDAPFNISWLMQDQLTCTVTPQNGAYHGATTPDHTTPEPPSLTSPTSLIFPSLHTSHNYSLHMNPQEKSHGSSEFEELRTGSSTQAPGTLHTPSPEAGLSLSEDQALTLTYFNQPEAFVHALEGELDSSGEDPEGGSAAQVYHATHVQHCQQLDGLRKAFEGVTFIHKGGKVDGPIDSSIITAWNAFEQHLH